MKKFTKYLILFAAAAIAVACVFSGCGGVYEHVHAYGEPEWSWADIYPISNVTATFTCTECGHQEAICANFETAEDGTTTAVVTLEDTVYSITLP